MTDRLYDQLRAAMVGNTSAIRIRTTLVPFHAG